MTTIHHMKQNIFLTMLFCLLTALPQSAGAKGDSIRTFTVEHPLVYEDSWDLWPYVFLNENGEPDGYNIDLLKLIFKELDIPYIIKLMPTLDAQNDLREGKSDLMLRMDAEFTQGNSIFGNNVVQLFTHSIVTPTDKPVKIENIRSLARYTVIVHEGSFSHYLIKKNKWAKKIEPFDDMKEAIQKVSTLDDGIIVWNTMSLKWLMQKYHTDNLSITPIDLPYGEYKFMSNNPRLLQVIDSVYTSLKANDKLQPIQNKWFYPERTYSGLPGWLTKTAYVFGIMALAVLLYYLVYHFRVRQMTKAVRKRNNRLALILRTGQVTLWTCDVQTRTLTWLDQQGKPIKNIALDDFVHHYRPEDVRHVQLALDDIAARMLPVVGHIKLNGRRILAIGVKIIDGSELCRDLAAYGVFQKLTCQLFFQLLCLFLIFRQEHHGFDIDKPRRHREKLRGNIHLIFLHAPDLLHVLVKQRGNLDIINIYFVFRNQRKQ